MALKRSFIFVNCLLSLVLMQVTTLFAQGYTVTHYRVENTNDESAPVVIVINNAPPEYRTMPSAPLPNAESSNNNSILIAIIKALAVIIAAIIGASVGVRKYRRKKRKQLRPVISTESPQNPNMRDFSIPCHVQNNQQYPNTDVNQYVPPAIQNTIVNTHGGPNIIFYGVDGSNLSITKAGNTTYYNFGRNP